MLAHHVARYISNYQKKTSVIIKYHYILIVDQKITELAESHGRPFLGVHL